jgi:hypothetical protein
MRQSGRNLLAEFAYDAGPCIQQVGRKKYKEKYLARDQPIPGNHHSDVLQ